MLEDGQEPVAFTFRDRPIVLPCGLLEYREPVEDVDGLSPFEDPFLQAVPETDDLSIFEAFDLTR